MHATIHVCKHTLSLSRARALTRTSTRTHTRTHQMLVGMWLFNPIVINVSTRGNAEALVSLLVLASLCGVLGTFFLFFSSFPPPFCFQFLYYAIELRVAGAGSVL